MYKHIIQILQTPIKHNLVIKLLIVHICFTADTPLQGSSHTYRYTKTIRHELKGPIWRHKGDGSIILKP